MVFIRVVQCMLRISSLIVNGKKWPIVVSRIFSTVNLMRSFFSTTSIFFVIIKTIPLIYIYRQSKRKEVNQDDPSFHRFSLPFRTSLKETRNTKTFKQLKLWTLIHFVQWKSIKEKKKVPRSHGSIINNHVVDELK